MTADEKCEACGSALTLTPGWRRPKSGAKAVVRRAGGSLAALHLVLTSWLAAFSGDSFVPCPPHPVAWLKGGERQQLLFIFKSFLTDQDKKLNSERKGKEALGRC